jgi:hypothetical protein
MRDDIDQHGEIIPLLLAIGRVAGDNFTQTYLSVPN